MKAFKAVMKRAKYAMPQMLRQGDLAVKGAESKGVAKSIAFVDPHTKHRSIIDLYDLSPAIMARCFIAPNATIVGEVLVGSNTSVWYGCVIRGDVNSVRIGGVCVIGDNTVIHTAGSLPTGIPASVEIGDRVVVQSNCTLYSCNIAEECLIGHKTVVLEGARLEKGCAIGPNSVVPPGRIIPSGQLWAGNPVTYIRDLNKGELQNIVHLANQYVTKLHLHKYEYLPYNSAYLQKENTDADLHVDYNQMKDYDLTADYFSQQNTRDEV